MKKMISTITGLVVALFCLASAVQADAFADYASRWDVIKYSTPDKDARIAAYEKLIADAKAADAKEPTDPTHKMWAAVSLATLAGDVGAMGGALGKVTEAKELLEAALQLNPNGDMKGYMLTTLGSLYYQVPGWPLGFGDSDKAEEYLLKGLEFSPNGLDSNFWMASYLWEETRKYEEAGQYFIKAINAPDRPGRKIADEGRKAKAAELLAKVEKKLGRKVALK